MYLLKLKTQNIDGFNEWQTYIIEGLRFLTRELELSVDDAAISKKSGNRPIMVSYLRVVSSFSY